MTSSAELARWRSDTPMCATGRIHLNNAGAAAMPRTVIAAMHEHLDREAVHGGYEAADDAQDRVADAYAAVAATIGAAAHNVALVENATAAYAQALSSFAFEPGDRILTTRNDSVSNQLMLLSLARRFGAEIVRAADSPDGGVDPESVRQLVDRVRPRLVSVTHVPTNSGLVQPIEAVGEICAARGVPYLVDACQSVGQLEVDVGRLRCDFLCATARKFLRGPRGIGFLYVSDSALAAGVQPEFVDLRGAEWYAADDYRIADDARRFENWEFAYALVLGLGAAARYALAAGSAGRTRAVELGAALRERLAALEGVRVLDRGAVRGAIVTIGFERAHARDVAAGLRERGINTSVTLREYAVIDMDDKGVASALRLSPHYYNTLEELDRAVAVLRELLA